MCRHLMSLLGVLGRGACSRWGRGRWGSWIRWGICCSGNPTPPKTSINNHPTTSSQIQTVRLRTREIYSSLPRKISKANREITYILIGIKIKIVSQMFLSNLYPTSPRNASIYVVARASKIRQSVRQTNAKIFPIFWIEHSRWMIFRRISFRLLSSLKSSFQRYLNVWRPKKV